VIVNTDKDFIAARVVSARSQRDQYSFFFFHV
jgi:hypothetical protein